jgi:hypothetical protein
MVNYQFPYMGTENQYTPSVLREAFSHFQKIIFSVFFVSDRINMYPQLAYAGSLNYTKS